MERILVIEDDADLRSILAETLRKQGFVPMEAASGEEAVELSLSQPPDLILLDLRLPGINGWQTLELLQDAARSSNIPVVVVTASDDVRNRVRAYFANTADYLLKPFQLQELIACVRRALARRGTANQSAGAPALLLH